MRLFVPEKDGTYRVWRSDDAAIWDESVLADDDRMFALIDPPEKDKSTYSEWCLACMIEFVPNNEYRDYHNFL